jgi:hypothetical protein
MGGARGRSTVTVIHFSRFRGGDLSQYPGCLTALRTHPPGKPVELIVCLRLAVRGVIISHIYSLVNR